MMGTVEVFGLLSIKAKKMTGKKEKVHKGSHWKAKHKGFVLRLKRLFKVSSASLCTFPFDVSTLKVNEIH